MDIQALHASELFSYVILPILIFASRILDQSMGILRILFATKGLRSPAFIVGFFESLIWLVAVGQIMSQLDNIYCYIAFSLGFATGNVVGIYLEKKLSIGYVMVRVIFQKDSEQTVELLRNASYKFTLSDAIGMNNTPIKMIFCTTKRKTLQQFLNILEENNPLAFYTVEDVKMIHEGNTLPRKKWNFKHSVIK